MAVVNYNQSRVKMFRRCQKQYSFRYDYHRFYPGLAGKGREMVPKVLKLPLYRGTWMHALQETLHHEWADATPFTITVGEGRQSVKGEVKTWKDTHALLTEAFNSLFDEEKEDLDDLPTDCARLFKDYLRFWEDDRDRYEVAYIDGRPAIELMIEVSLAEFGLKDAQFKGKIDLIVEDHEYEGLWIWDAKWMKKIPPPDERMMSPQALLYVWGLREMYGLDVRGFVYNYGRTKAPAWPRVLQRPAGMLSTAHKMDTTYSTYLAAIKANHGKHWKKYIDYYLPKLRELKGREAMWFSRDRIPTEPSRINRALREYISTVSNMQYREDEREYIPRSYFYNCKWGCDYHDICAAEFQGHEIEPLIRRSYQFVGERYTEQEDLMDA